MKKPTLLLGIIAVAIVCSIAYTSIYVPAQQQVQLIQTQKTKERASQRTQADVAALLKTIEAYRKRLPSEGDPSWLVRETVALAQKAGVEISSINQEDPQKFSGFTRLAVNLQFTASYHQLGAFLDAIEHGDHFIRVDRIGLSRSNSRSGEGMASIKLAFSTIYLPPVLTGS